MAESEPWRGARPAPETENRRRAERRETDAFLVVSIEAQALEGRADNVSESGVFLFAGDRVRVRVELGGKVRSGRIVRLQTMNERETGLAIEFDRE
jgi:hypothetical protein